MVTRHRAIADGTKRTSRDLSAAPPDQNQARPASEVVRDLLQRRGGAPRTPSYSAREKGEGTQVHRCSRKSMASWRLWPSAKLLRQLQYTGRIVVFAVLPTAFFPSWSCDSDSETRRDYSLFSPSGCGCHCATPFLRRVQCRSGSQTLQKETTALSILFSFQCSLRLFPRDALLRFSALSGHWPFAGDSEASGC